MFEDLLDNQLRREKVEESKCSDNICQQTVRAENIIWLMADR